MTLPRISQCSITTDSRQITFLITLPRQIYKESIFKFSNFRPLTQRSRPLLHSTRPSKLARPLFSSAMDLALRLAPQMHQPLCSSLPRLFSSQSRNLQEANNNYPFSLLIATSASMRDPRHMYRVLTLPPATSWVVRCTRDPM